MATINITAWDGSGIRPDVLAWMLAHNPGLQQNFLKTAAPDTVVLLPNGQSLPIYKLSQFLDVNFKFNFSARRKEGINLVEAQQDHLRKLLANPLFYHAIKDHASHYLIGGKGRVTAEEAYRYIRNINRHIYVTADPRLHAPVGGGNGINAPSWAVWKQMNLFWHETCHVIAIGHNSGGISGPIAGFMRDWDRQHRWDYDTFNVNSLEPPQ